MDGRLKHLEALSFGMDVYMVVIFIVIFIICLIQINKEPLSLFLAKRELRKYYSIKKSDLKNLDKEIIDQMYNEMQDEIEKKQEELKEKKLNEFKEKILLNKGELKQ
ncbi:MAG: hypothetical protein ACRDB9_08570 [Cetobacterium sp.]